MTDYHCHVLPGMDDGAENVSVAVQMLELLWEQGVQRVTATPHFYAHQEDGVNRYLEKRRHAWEQLMEAVSVHPGILPEIQLGAEIRIEQGVSRQEGLEELRLGSTSYILLELPYAPFAHWMLEEVEAVAHMYRLTPVLAHVHRYVYFYRKPQLEDLLRTDAVFQINNSAFRQFRERKFSWRMIKEGYPYLFGSDAHNMTDRRPDWDFLKKRVKPEVLAEAEDLFLHSAYS